MPPSPSKPRTRWRLVVGHGGDGGGDDVPSPDDGALNMAVDAALLDSVSGGAPPVIRLYRWSPAALSFGRNQPARGLYDEEAAATRGITFVRRPTGGQAVLHDDELTYALVAPVGIIGKPRTAYRRINDALLVGLRELGLEAAMARAEDVARGGSDGRGAGDVHRAEEPDQVGEHAGVAPRSPAGAWGDACFRRPERGEVVVGGRKLVGSAQRTRDRTILQHGSILLGGTQAPAEELLRASAGFGDGPSPIPGAHAPLRFREGGWTTVEAELGSRPEVAALVAALVLGFEVTLGITLARTTLTSREDAGAGALRDRFRSPAWTWRR